MQNYINQIIQDIEQTILRRWTENPPHLFRAGIPERYLIEPEGLEKFKEKDNSFDESKISVESKEMMGELEFEKTIAEAERYVEGDGPQNMFYHFGFMPQQFPSADKLTDEQLGKLTHVILRLWATFNYTAVFPEKTPARIIYPMLIERMHEPTLLFENGNIGIEFCAYDPDTCPFGEYCDCYTQLIDMNKNDENRS